MKFWNLFKKQEDTTLKQDGLQHGFSGMGGVDDKLEMFSPYYSHVRSVPRVNLDWWDAISILRKVINFPAEDSLRNGFCVLTNFDKLDPKSQDLKANSESLSRYIQNRLDDLEISKILLDAIRFLRIYSNGCLLYYIVDSDIPQSSGVLNQPFPELINEIKGINVLEDGKFGVYYKYSSLLSPFYNKPTILIEGIEIHPSRFRWLVKDYNRDLQSGKSILDDVIEEARSNSIAKWSITTMIFEMATKIFKSPDVGKSLNDSRLKDFLKRMRMALSSQSILALHTEEDFVKTTYNLSGLKEVLDWFMDNLAIVSEVPQARLKGAAHGVLASGAYDMQAYFENVSRMQHIYLYKPLCDIIRLVLKEKNIQTIVPLNILPYLDWDIKFNPLWELSPVDKANLEKTRAERDKLDIESGKITPAEARKLDPRMSELEDFDVGEE